MEYKTDSSAMKGTLGYFCGGQIAIVNDLHYLIIDKNKLRNPGDEAKLREIKWPSGSKLVFETEISR